MTCSERSRRYHQEEEARLGMLTGSDQNKKLKLSSWSGGALLLSSWRQKLAEISGSTETRLAKDVEKCFSLFSDLDVEKCFSLFSEFP